MNRLGSTLNRATLHLLPGDVCRRKRDAVRSSPDTPRLLQPAALIEARIARETHTGWLLTPVFVARRKEAAPVALLAWMDHAAAGRLQLLGLWVPSLVVAVDAAGTGLRRAQLGVIKGLLHKPADSITLNRHSEEVDREEEAVRGVKKV